MSTKRTRRLFSLLVATAIVVTSCGGGDSDSSSSGNRQRNAALTSATRRVRTGIRHFMSTRDASMAISNEDQMVVWGDRRLDRDGLLDPPVSKVRLAALADDQGVAIDLNNQFHAWGMDKQHMSVVPDGIDLSRVKSLILDQGVVITIDENGKLSAWGRIWDGNPAATIPAEVTNSKIVQAATYNSQLNLALTDQGKVIAWGNLPAVAEAQAKFADVTAKRIYVTGTRATVVTTDGKVIEAGSGARAGLFEGVNVEHLSIDPSGNALAIDTDKKLHFSAGRDVFEQALGDDLVRYNNGVNDDSPSAISITAVESTNFVVLFDDGEILELAQYWDTWRDLPDYFYSNRSVSPISAGNYTSFAVRDDYTITNFHTLREGESAPPAEADYLAVASGWFHVLGLRTNGTVVSWGDGPDGNAIPEGLAPVRQIGAGHGFSAVRDIFGQISSWGSFQSTNESKEKPDGDFVYRRMSTGFHNIIATGYDRGDGSDVVHVWGDNYYGQADVPDDLDASNVRDVSVGYDCAAAVMYDGSVRIWGKCETNQKAIPAGEQFDSVEMSMGLIAGITFDGDVLAWGNYSAELGTKPTDMKNVAEIAVGSQHIIALDYNGGVSVWGPNVWGESNVPDDLKPLPVDDVYDENYDDNLSDEAENVTSQMESAKNPIPTPTIIDDAPVFVVKNGEVVSVPPTAPSVPDVTPILEKEPVSMTVLPATLNPVTKTGKVVKVADAVKLLGLKKITKAAFVVPSKVTTANAKVCSITKTAVTITGTGICDVKLSYVDSKKKKRTKALPLIAAP